MVSHKYALYLLSLYSQMKYLFLLLFMSATLFAEEPIRTFTAQGKSIQARAVEYKGKLIVLENAQGQRFQVSYDILSKIDQDYMRKIVMEKKIPEQGVIVKPKIQPKVEKPKIEEPKQLVLQPIKKETFREGSFFRHPPIFLGEDPSVKKNPLDDSLPMEGQPIDFNKHLLPILNAKCNDCHAAPYMKGDRKIAPKAGLQLDNYEMVMKGNLNGEIVTAGKPDESYLYEVVTLPTDDEMFMPPKGTAMTPNEVDILKRWISEGARKTASADAIAEMPKIPSADQPVSFDFHIMPIMKESCIDCHSAPFVKNGRTIRPKAALQLDTYEMIMKGNLDGTIIEPFKPEVSSLYNVVTLPHDDPELMPHKGDPLTKEQTDTIKRWILEGAGKEPAKEAADINAKPILAKIEAPVVDDENLKKVDLLGKRLRPIGKAMLESAMASGALVSPLSIRHSMVRVEFPSGPNLIEDSSLSALSSIKNNISHINFASTNISDKAMAFVAGSPNLVYLNLRNTSITDRGIALIAKAQHLEYLNLVSTQVTDKSINTIANIKTLKSIYTFNSGITESGLEVLQTALPNAKIVY